MSDSLSSPVIGVDGCKAGWVGVERHDNGASHRIRLFQDFSDILNDPAGFAIIAVDMPIGLPGRIVGSGRGPEQAVRPLLGKRRSSVFSIPARSAVEATDYREGCELALKASDPPRKFSKQAFNIFPKILEIDRVMNPSLENRVFEVHPEVAFWRLNGERALDHPKKGKGGLDAPGPRERMDILRAHGLARDFLNAAAPKGAAMDDVLDACACAVIAERLASGRAEAFPSSMKRDDKGLRIAIWA
ncbi:MAG: DUF429 domain-containing protein [Pseudomonadota bacterium]